MGARALASVLLVGFLAAPAMADTAAIDINRFHPALGSETIMATELAAVGPRWQLAPQLFIHYADAPMVLTIGGEKVSDVVRDRVTGELGISFSPWQRFQLGLSFPVTLFQGSDPVSLIPVELDSMPVNPPAQIAESGMEDLRLSAKGVLWQSRDRNMGLGLSGRLAVPTGDGDSYLGSRLPTFDARLIGHYKNGRLTTGINLGWLFASTEQVLLTRTGMGITFSAGAEYEVYRQQDGVRVALAGELAGLAHSRFESSRESPMELLLAAKSRYRQWTFYVGTGLGLTVGYGEPNFRVLSGVSFGWTPPKRPPHQVRVTPAAPPPPPPEDKEAPEKQWVESTMTLPSDVLFEYDRCAINPDSYADLRKVATMLKEHPEWGDIRIEGHASYEGLQKDEYNLRLSSCRAGRIARFLVYYGVAESRLTHLGFGYRCPAVPNDTDANRRRNRRVEFVRDPENNPPRCEIPPQLAPLPKHAAEPELYRAPEAEGAMPPGGQTKNPAPPSSPSRLPAPAGEEPATPPAASPGPSPATPPAASPGPSPAAPATSPAKPSEQRGAPAEPPRTPPAPLP